MSDRLRQIETRFRTAIRFTTDDQHGLHSCLIFWEDCEWLIDEVKKAEEREELRLKDPHVSGSDLKVDP